MTIPSFPAEHYRYVRVQDDLHGMHADGDGRLVLTCAPDATRNTMHFAINGVVSDHAYGRFNTHRDGALKGKVVIIADPQEMGVPAGFNQADTWFRMGAQKNDDGTLTRDLNAGHATIVVPEGTSVPGGVNAVFYDGSIEGRDAAVAKTLAEQHIVQREIGFRSWKNSNEGDAPVWAKTVAAQIYPENAHQIHIGMHDASPDGYMEAVGIAARVESFRQAGRPTFVNNHGISENYIDAIENVHSKNTVLVRNFVAGLDPDERKRCGPFYERLKEKLDQDLVQAQLISAEVAVKQKAWTASFIATEDMLSTLAPHGEIYLAKANGSGVEKVSPHDLAYRLMDRNIQASQQVWMQGQSQWQAMAASPLRDVYYRSIGQEAPSQKLPPPLPAILPPLDEPQSLAQQAESAMRELRDAVEKNLDCALLGELFDTAVSKTIESVQVSGTSASAQTIDSLVYLGDTIKSLAAMDGDVATVASVDASMKTSARQLRPLQERAFVESTPEFAF